VEPNSINPLVVELRKPDGSLLASTGAIGPAGGFVDAVELTSDGTYTISADPVGAATGLALFALFNVPNNVVAKVAVGDRPVRLDVSEPGHNPTAEFDGAAGQQVVASAGPGNSVTRLSIRGTDGSSLGSTSIGATGGTVGPITLPGAGTYSVALDPIQDDMDGRSVEVFSNGAPQNTQTPSVSGSPAIGEVLTTTSGAWSGSSGAFSYQWQMCGLPNVCFDLADATAPTYTVTEDDVDGTIRAIVSTQNASGARAVYSTSTALVTSARTAPKATFSYYVSITSPAAWEALGNQLGTSVANGTRPKRALVILHFGRPAKIGSAQAVLPHADGRISLATVRAIVNSYALGFVETAPPLGRLWIGVGLSNDNNQTYSDPNVTFAHGQAWGELVNDINADFDATTTPCVRCKVNAFGANDIEVNWSARLAPRRLVQGYQGRAKYLYLHFGDAAGCPNTVPASGAMLCNNNWRVEDVRWLAWGAPGAFPFPQIYTESGFHPVLQGDQWKALSKFSVTRRGGRLMFLGTLAQRQACLDRPAAAGCATEDHLRNTAGAAWSQLYTRIQGDPQLRTPIIHSSDIRWNNE
jgi:hypothetical protein